MENNDTTFNEQINTEEFVVNIGPQHPSTHGVLRIEATLDGETVKDILPHLGYIHRGIEKMSEHLGYKQSIYLTSRMDYLSAHINNHACSLLIEKACGIEVPERAKAIRLIMDELQRLTSHQLWWGSCAMDIGAVTPFFLGFRDRERILDIFEANTGNRLTMNYIVPGGVMKDVLPNFVSDVRHILYEVKNNLKEYDRLITGNFIFQHRTKGVGYLDKETAISLGCTGPVARASGVQCDVRKLYPYDGYEKLEFKEIINSGGDSWARYVVRMEEMRQSIHIIEQLLDNFPEGEVRTKIKGILKVPAGEYYQRVETARGELGVYMVSDGSAKPYRLKYRTPCFSNLGAVNAIGKGLKLGDLMAAMATIDLVIPDMDR
ncbi:MAG: NADH-quinone oxidoreductase subunit D [Bacteroidota bacterium]|uniref:NADH-quinone oxidoreductase subunit D n=1 Tax=Parabacteroides chartae TaxID=1037355 RepID=A0A1T5CBZ7_9BACT|nr:NADH-quinone oxidoreductase subunit D [Parabacteroides chartae]MDT3369711.1 NADH-quinone oxidoreductase subunit D [Bacteroidota bacterium]SKB56978.1 NADH-quinone oxidoreductase subunit D [Parabacteroides chartae]